MNRALCLRPAILRANEVAIDPRAAHRNTSEGIFEVCFSMPLATGPSSPDGLYRFLFKFFGITFSMIFILRYVCNCRAVSIRCSYCSEKENAFSILKLFIKNMVNLRSLVLVEAELMKLGLRPVDIGMGEADVLGEMTIAQQVQLRIALRQSGLDL